MESHTTKPMAPATPTAPSGSFVDGYLYVLSPQPGSRRIPVVQDIIDLIIREHHVDWNAFLVRDRFGRQ